MTDSRHIVESSAEEHRLKVPVKSDGNVLVALKHDKAHAIDIGNAGDIDTNEATEGVHGNREDTAPEASGVEQPDSVVQVHHVWTGRKKEKSALCLLCEDFLYKFGHVNEDGSPQNFQMNVAAAHCGAPRRRMYDVINVLEAIGVVKRTAKLKYLFQGYDGLPQMLTSILETDSVETEDNSVGMLTTKMIRLLLENAGIMTLGNMAAKLIGPNIIPQRVKKQRSQRQITIERRLYDIASILTSIGLLEKVQGEKRVPTLVWTYGWMPGNEHDPPILDVARMALEPRPHLEPLSDEQIKQSSRKRKAGSEQIATDATAHPAQPNFQLLHANVLDEDNISKMILANSSAMLHSFPRQGLIPGMDAQDSLGAGLDPSALAALLAAQQNMPDSSPMQQVNPGMITGDIPQEMMMQFQKYGLLYPYMMQQSMQHANPGSSAESPSGQSQHKS